MTGAGVLPDVAPGPPNGVPPQAPDGASPPWIALGPRTRAQMARVLEPQLAAVWVALLETSGVPDGAPYRLVISGAHLEPEAAPSP